MLFVLLRRLVPLVATLLIGQAGATTFTVTSNSDEIDPDDGVITLREAVTLANGDADEQSVITIDLADGAIIRLSESLQLDQKTQINGYGTTISLVLPAAEPLTLAPVSAPALFQVSEQASGSVLNGLTLEAGDAAHLVAAAGDLLVYGCHISGFDPVTRITGAAPAIEFDGCLLTDNTSVLDETASNGSGATPLTGGSLRFRNSLLEDNGRVAHLTNNSTEATPFIIALEHSRLTGQDGDHSFVLQGATSLVLDQSTVDGNTPLSLIRSNAGDFGNSPEVDISNSTLSGNAWTAPKAFINADGPGLFISHSTLTNNTPADRQPLINATNAFVRHSVLSGNHGVTRDLAGSGETLYSLVDTTGTGFTALSPVTGDPMLGPLTFRGNRTGSHLPDPLSPLIDAGAPTLTAGDDGTPEEDQRGSDRIISGTIDIGAVEFNREPQVDLATAKQAFREETGEALNIRRVSTDDEIFLAFLDIVIDPGDIVIGGGGGSGWGGSIIIGLPPGFDQPITGLMSASAATVASERIYVDLDNFITDPDSDVIDRVGLSLRAGEIFELDSATQQLSGTREDFLDHPVALALRDEHGLVATHAFQVLPASPEEEGSDGGAGSGLLLLVALGWLRRRL